MNGKRAMTMKQAKESGLLSESDYIPPMGEWTGKLVAKCWGNSRNLICFFEDVATGKQYKLSAFSNEGTRYCPKDDGIDFSESGIEGLNYLIETALSSKGNPAWLAATLIE
ncbi:MAG: hypothetical protein ACYCYL_02180 [Acidithiobacillus sp.]